MHTWEETKAIIANKELHKFRRSPEQSLIYKQSKIEFTEKYGGTAEFVISERLKWNGDKLKPKGEKFMECEEDLKILVNDFPYNWEPGIEHFVVWSKLKIPCGEDEMPTPEASEMIEKYIKENFGGETLWFKNTLVLQSIPSVSHFHVLVKKEEIQH